MKSVEAMQTALEDFGFGGSIQTTASFIYNNVHFTAVLGFKIYPVLQPREHYGIYQTWQ